MQFDDFLADQISFLDSTHIDQGFKHDEFQLSSREGRSKFNYFEDSNFESVYKYLLEAKKSCLVFQLP